ncbi:unnamed protein product [Brassica rapa]|uniref:Uncharacterized protein n=1 Tax=Brassica campestris TaxID=3711 RepID=A0A8D9CSS4_BRACM|nr:unnamed protein product [Brassica rapa]
MWALVVYKASEEMRMGPMREKRKAQRLQSHESAPVIARTPREKRKPQRLQSPYTQVKTEDIDGPKKKRKTKAK